MVRGYIRVAAYGQTEEEQRTLLERAPEPPGAFYVDYPPPKRRKPGAPEFPERQKLILSLRPGAGDVVLLVDESIIGKNLDDMLGAMARIADRGAVVRVARTALDYDWGPRDALMMDFVRDGEHIRKKHLAAHARRTLNKMGKGGVKALKGAKKDKAKAAWFDPKRSGEEVAEEFGVSRTTLHNYFGPRNTPDATQKGRRQ